MHTTIHNLTVCREGHGVKVTAYINSDRIHRSLEGWLDRKSSLIIHAKSKNEYEQREAICNISDLLLEQNRCFDELAGSLEIINYKIEL
jgi:hypothetical protein